MAAARTRPPARTPRQVAGPRPGYSATRAIMIATPRFRSAPTPAGSLLFGDPATLPTLARGDHSALQSTVADRNLGDISEQSGACVNVTVPQWGSSCSWAQVTAQRLMVRIILMIVRATVNHIRPLNSVVTSARGGQKWLRGTLESLQANRGRL
jgi:hypothetical protein